MIQLRCPTCHQKIQYNLVDVVLDHISKWFYVQCLGCGATIHIGTDLIVEDTNSSPTTNLPDDSQVLEIGDSVTITNKEHPWFKEIALVCGRNHGHFRLELHGIRIWMPKNWVVQHEPDTY